MVMQALWAISFDYQRFDSKQHDSIRGSIKKNRRLIWIFVQISNRLLLMHFPALVYNRYDSCDFHFRFC